MGALHDGHVALMRRCRAQCDIAAISIFVNPKQFDSAGDLAEYPRDLQRDLDLAEHWGMDLVWAPSEGDIYPDGFLTAVTVAGLSELWEGSIRRGHFGGVATVVTKLLSVIRPALAYFGQKDAQQLAVVRRLVRDLGIDTEIVSCPTVRESDGLALSSRNRLLEPRARRRAATLYSSLVEVSVKHWQAIPATLHALRTAADEVDYLAVVDRATFRETNTLSGPVLAIGAAWFGGVRLIDNVPLSADGQQADG